MFSIHIRHAVNTMAICVDPNKVDQSNRATCIRFIQIGRMRLSPRCVFARLWGGLVSRGGAGFSETRKVMRDERCLNQGTDRNVSGS